MDLRAAIAAGAIQIEPIQGLERGKRHSDGAGVDFAITAIDLVAALPNSVIRRPVSAANVVDQILDERDLHGTPDQVNSSRDHLCQREQVERSGIELEMAPLVVGGNRLAESGVVFSVQGIERVLCVLESLNLCRLAHHRREQPAHQPDHCVFEFAAPTIIGRMAPIRERQAPYGINAIDVIANPGIGVVSVHRYRRAGRQEAGHRMLPRQNYRLNRLKVTLELVQAFLASL